MFYRVLALVACSFYQPSGFAPPRPFTPPIACLADYRSHLCNGDRMSSGLFYSTVLPIVAHRWLPLGTLVDLRFGGRVTRGIVLDNFVTNRRVDIEVSPVLSRRLGILWDGYQPVTLEVVGFEPRSRWIHAIGALTP